MCILGDLQIEGIIARSPSPTPLEERDEADLSPEEMRELLRRMRAREQEQVKVKREKRDRTAAAAEDDDDDDVTIAEEPRARKRHRTFQEAGVEVIDLSDH